jgi:dTDP-4-dehydrorhamnose reductase
MIESKILLLGATGLLGSSLTPYLKTAGYNVFTHARKQGTADFIFDLDDWDSSSYFLTRIKPTIIVNMVGLTSVDQSQQNMHEALLTNTQTVVNIAKWIKQTNASCHLIHISTDHVYDGLGPHNEKNTTLTNNYSVTKYAGEIAAAQVESSILRTNFVGRSMVNYRQSLTDWVYTSIVEGKNLKVLSDVLFSPLSIKTLVNMIKLVIQKKPIGIYNLGSNQGMSKADFDFEFADKLGLPLSSMERIQSSDAKFLKVYRPKDMRMDCSKFEKLFELTLPTLAAEIADSVIDYDYYEKT